MNCPKCGSLTPPGAAYCPVCNEPLSQSYAAPQGYGADPGYGYQQPGYMQQPVYVQQPGGYPPQAAGGYAQPYQQMGNGYQQSAYPTGYQQPYQYGEQRPNPFSSAIGELPHTFLQCLREPGEALRGLLERNDTVTGLLVCGVTLALTFFGGMTLLRGFMGSLFSTLASVLGLNVSSEASALNQNLNAIAGRVGPAAGGVAVLCQLFAILIPAVIACVYLLAICKTPFSWPLALGLICVPTCPTAVALLVAMLLSLLSPWLALAVVLCGAAFSYLQLGLLMEAVTGRSGQQGFAPRAVCLCLSLALTLAALALVGGNLSVGVFNRVLTLLSSAGSIL